MMILLTTLSALTILVFVALLSWYLHEVAVTLEKIGGSPDSYLARIGFGVRAIEKQTGQLEPEVTRLNEGLGGLSARFQSVERQLSDVADALDAQGGPL